MNEENNFPGLNQNSEPDNPAILEDESLIERLWAWMDARYLPDLPRDKAKLRQLTVLDLFDNNLTRLPPEIGQLTQLTELDLAACRT